MTQPPRAKKPALIVAGMVALAAAGVFLRFRQDLLSGLCFGVALGLFALGFRSSRDA